MNKDMISRKYVVKELLKEREQYPPMVAERYSFGVKSPHRFNQATRGGIRKALRIVETAPAVDAEPVRHARWVEEADRRNHWHCSNCERTEGMAHFLMYYCPNCGAKMMRR